MAKVIDEKVKANEEALAKLSSSSIESIVAKESSIEDQEKALQEKLDALATKKAEVVKEKEIIDAEMQKIPPFLATKLLDLQNLDNEIRTSQTKRAEDAKNLKGELVKAELKEDFVNKVLGLKGLGAPKAPGTGKPKVTAEEKQQKIMDSITGGAHTKTEIYKDVGMSQNTRDNLKALVDEGKIVIDGDQKYKLASE